MEVLTLPHLEDLDMLELPLVTTHAGSPTLI